ncbi:MAG: PaaI family thioesterase [Bacteroidetes bacterium]|nr:PaaI family thioesterase [Bacteroidota bacterium]
MEKRSFQDFYPDDYSHCYGCGRLNAKGHQLKSFWNGDETIARFTPKEYHTAVPGFVYGGLIASLIDCHGTGTAAAAMYKKEGRAMDSHPPLRFVTAALHVNYLKPTPLGVELELRGVIKEITKKKVVVDISVSANGILCARENVVAVKIPDEMMK